MVVPHREGWVERSMLETKEGDLHAVAKMEAALQQAENVRQGGPGRRKPGWDENRNSVRVAV
jgi:hypothetical protein